MLPTASANEKAKKEKAPPLRTLIEERAPLLVDTNISSKTNNWLASCCRRPPRQCLAWHQSFGGRCAPPPPFPRCQRWRQPPRCQFSIRRAIFADDKLLGNRPVAQGAKGGAAVVVHGDGGEEGLFCFAKTNVGLSHCADSSAALDVERACEPLRQRRCFRSPTASRASQPWLCRAGCTPSSTAALPMLPPLMNSSPMPAFPILVCPVVVMVVPALKRLSFATGGWAGSTGGSSPMIRSLASIRPSGSVRMPSSPTVNGPVNSSSAS